MAVRRDKRGKWRYRKQIRLPDGRKERIFGTPALNTKLATEEAERAHIQRALSPSSQKMEVPTFNKFADEFMATYVRSNNRPSEQASKECILTHHLRPALGTTHLDEISIREVEQLKAALLAAKKSPKRVNNILVVLGKMLRYAHDLGILASVPKLQLLKLPPPDFDFLDFDEYPRLLDAARQEHDVYSAILLGGDAGLRMGEILALEFDDIDLRTGTLNVIRSDWHGLVGPPKGGRKRTIPMTERLKVALRDQRHLRSGRILCGEDGTAWTRDVMKRGMRRAYRRAKLRALGWHVLRHTFCSHLAMHGAPAKAIQELAGHASLTVTMRYMHLAKSTLAGAIRLLETEIRGNSVATPGGVA